jgi:hypothetical protein
MSSTIRGTVVSLYILNNCAVALSYFLANIFLMEDVKRAVGIQKAMRSKSALLPKQINQNIKTERTHNKEIYLQK